MDKMLERVVCRKLVIRICMMLLILPVCMLFVGCGDDDDAGNAPSENNLLVGMWKTEYSDGDYDILEFNEGGTGFASYYYSNVKSYTEFFTYEYNAGKKILCIWYEDETEQCTVDLLTSDVMVIDGDIYNRIK